MQERVIALGFFDGVHIGHGALLEKTRQRAQDLGLSSAVMTLDQHPSKLLQAQPDPLLTTPQDRADLIKRLYHIDDVIFAHFDRSMLEEPWDVFLERYLVGTLHARHAVCGHDYRFGYRGQGTAQRLAQWCQAHDMGCDIIPKVTLQGQTVSSTCIRTLLAAGDLETANRYLGHPHCLSGTVIHGQHLGRTLGIPTANIPMPSDILTLPFGVYATKVWVDGAAYTAVTNVGVRPTVHGKDVTVESWILHLDNDLYGKQITVEFYHAIRPERKFASLQDMQTEIRKNAIATEAYFQAHPTACASI